MVIDLDETLVHSSFKVFTKHFYFLLYKVQLKSKNMLISFVYMFQAINNADFVVPVEIDGTVHQVYVLKRPHVDEFLQRMGELYECVLFTASLAKVNISVLLLL